MAKINKNIGLSLGADLCWPAAFEELLKRSIEHQPQRQ